jgi:hypothetical protein
VNNIILILIRYYSNIKKILNLCFASVAFSLSTPPASNSRSSANAASPGSYSSPSSYTPPTGFAGGSASYPPLKAKAI